MKKNTTALVDEHLEYLRGMQEATTDDFFYTRLKARMEREEPSQGWGFPLKPVWVVGALVLLLAANGFTLVQRSAEKNKTTAAAPTLQNFAQSYDQVISSSY